MKAMDRVAKLVIRSHSGSEYEIPLVTGRTRIGRARDADVVLDDEFASRDHAAIERCGERHVVFDNGSTNGTLVNGERVAGDQVLRNGDEITIGETVITYREETSGQTTTRTLQPPSRDQLQSPVQVDTQAWEVWVEGNRLGQRLSVLEFKLLAYLYSRANAVCSRDDIATELWGEGGYTYEMLHQLVHRLKRRIEPDPINPKYIVSVSGVGYRLACSGAAPDWGAGHELQPHDSMAVILFADIADSTALTERLGDADFREKARKMDGSLREIIRQGGGTPIEGKLLGDGVLATFTSARQAIEASLACGRTGDDAGLSLHLGLHAGDVIREEDPDGRANVYGGAVNVASRISALSAPGEVLVSDIVRGLARTSAGVSFDDRGEQSLKGVSVPVRVWAVCAPDEHVQT